MIIAYLSAILWLVASIQAEATDNEIDELVMVNVGAWEASESEQSTAEHVSKAPEDASWEEEEGWPTTAAMHEEPTQAADKPCEEAQADDDDDDDWLQDGFEQEEEEWTLLEAEDA